MESPNVVPLNTNDHLIIVCCHAIYLGGSTHGQDPTESVPSHASRLIEDFQDPREIHTFLEHIRAGVRILSEKDKSVLLFSGGPTKGARTEMSEARSYFNAAKDNHYFNYPITPSHISTEDRAVDSYQNLLFSILRFHTLTSKFPAHITLISHDFKKRRFLELHVPAICWPKECIAFVGIDPPDRVVRREVLDKGEFERGYGAFEGDLYGVGEFLWGKRVARGWRRERGRGLWDTAMGDSVLELLEWSGGESGHERFPRRLPWYRTVDGDD